MVEHFCGRSPSPPPSGVNILRQKEKTMPKTVLAAGVALSLLGAFSGQVLADSVCYSSDGGAHIRLDVKFHSHLTGLREKRIFNHPVQRTYSVHGWAGATDIIPFVFAATGTVVVAQGVGARMSLTVPAVLDGFETAFYDCDTEVGEDSATPEEWSCLVLSVQAGPPTAGRVPATGLVTLQVLTRLDPLAERGCGAFATPSG
jgi:hypothetical protein